MSTPVHWARCSDKLLIFIDIFNLLLQGSEKLCQSGAVGVEDDVVGMYHLHLLGVW